MLGDRRHEALMYALALACCFGLAGDILTMGGLTWRWPIWATLFMIGFWHTYTGGKWK